MQMKHKDANGICRRGIRSPLLVASIMRTYVPAGVVGSSELYEKLLDDALVERFHFLVS